MFNNCHNAKFLEIAFAKECLNIEFKNKARKFQRVPQTSRNTESSQTGIDQNKKSKSLSFLTRSELYRRKSQEKLEVQREEKEKEALEECTFVPKINTESRRRRNYNEYYDDMMKSVVKKKSFLEREKQYMEENSETYSFQPKLCQNSKRIFKESGIVTFDMRCNKSSVKKDNTVMTKILDSISKELPLEANSNLHHTDRVRYSPSVNDFLNQNPRRRKKTEYDSPSGSSVALSRTSEKLAALGFMREFNFTTASMDIDNTGLLSYTWYRKLFKTMGFLKKGSTYNQDIGLILDIWEKLDKKYERVKICDVLVAMMAIMGYYQPWMNDPKSQSFVINKQQSREFNKNYIRLFYNRFGTSRAKTEKYHKQTSLPDYTYELKNIEESNESRPSYRKRSRCSAVYIEPEPLTKSKSIKNEEVNSNSLIIDVVSLRRASVQPNLLGKQSFRSFIDLKSWKNQDIKEVKSESEDSSSSSSSPNNSAGETDSNNQIDNKI